MKGTHNATTLRANGYLTLDNKMVGGEAQVPVSGASLADTAHRGTVRCAALRGASRRLGQGWIVRQTVHLCGDGPTRFQVDRRLF